MKSSNKVSPFELEQYIFQRISIIINITKHAYVMSMELDVPNFKIGVSIMFSRQENTVRGRSVFVLKKTSNKLNRNSTFGISIVLFVSLLHFSIGFFQDLLTSSSYRCKRFCAARFFPTKIFRTCLVVTLIFITVAHRSS